MPLNASVAKADERGALKPPDRRHLVGKIEILRVLVQKEVKIKYKRSALGFLWSLITPIALTAVYLFVFIYVYKVPKPDFILFLLSGLLPWNFFNMSIMAATTSLIDNAPMLRKVYFPRYLLPISTVAANLVTFLMGLIVLLGVVVISGRPFWLYIHWLLVAIFLEALLCLGVAFALSVWNVYLRDIGQLISIMTLVLFFGTPIVYEMDQVPAMFRPLILANPLASIMELYRSALYRPRPPDLGLVAIAIGETALVLMFGWLVFRKHAPDIPKQL